MSTTHYRADPLADHSEVSREQAAKARRDAGQQRSVTAEPPKEDTGGSQVHDS